METLRYNNGDEMPILGLGTWKSKPGEVYAAVKEAIRIGYRHIDCAAIYGNEVEVGKALYESVAEGLITRDQLWITSKLWSNAHAPEDVRTALEKTLVDLQLDYLDLYLVHWPVVIKSGVLFPRTAADMVALDELPVATTWSAMELLVEMGLCKHIGVSNFSVAKLNSLVNKAKQPPEMNQVEIHPYLQQAAMLDHCRDSGIHLMAYSPLGSPDRPSVLKSKGEPILLEDPTIREIADRHGVTPGQVLIRWAIKRGTAVIPKSVNPARIKENLGAAKLTLDDTDMQKIAELDKSFRYVTGSFWTMDGSPYTLANLWDE